MKDKVLRTVKEQEILLLRLKDTLEKRWLPVKKDKTFLYERAKFIGMVDIAKAVGIDTTEFQWVYNVI